MAFSWLLLMAKTAIDTHIAVVMVQQILGVAGMGIMAAGTGELPIRFRGMFDPSYRVPLAEETGKDMGACCLVLMTVDAEIGALHP